MSQERPNFKKLIDGSYLVRTQAGYRKALKDRYGDDLPEIELPVNYPTSYPAVIRLGLAYKGHHYATCQWKHLNHHIESLKRQLTELENE